MEAKIYCRDCGHDISGPGERDSYNRCISAVECLTRELRAQLAATDAALERWRHGEQIEGDYVCPDSLRMSELESQLDRWRDRLMEAIPEDIVADIKDVEELMDAAGATIKTLRREMVSASAEMRHAFRTKDWNLVSRAIQILERATTPK